MTASHQPPANPGGPFEPHEDYDEATKQQLIQSIEQAPLRLRAALAELTDKQLDVPYRNWTLRQITHHLADSHVHSYVRFKWALTEDQPTIKAYEEADWVMLEDALHGNIEPSLQLLEALHAKWVQLLSVMTREQYFRTFHHPQSGEKISLWHALNYYAWHGQHHTAQIEWVRSRQDW